MSAIVTRCAICGADLPRDAVTGGIVSQEIKYETVCFRAECIEVAAYEHNLCDKDPCPACRERNAAAADYAHDAHNDAQRDYEKERGI